MGVHNCDACIVTCIDFRLQENINNWLKENFPPKSFDRVAFGGGVKELDKILSQIDISKSLHSIKKVVLLNHEDCGAYGEGGNKKKHAEDLSKAKEIILKKYPDLEVETFYLHLDGTFGKI